MKRFYIVFLLLAISGGVFLFFSAKRAQAYCLTGAFLSDRPAKEDIEGFKNKYGKRPALIMVFVDWNHFVDEKVVEDIYSSGSVLFLTWEPWKAISREGIDYDGLLSGKWDGYIIDFAKRLKETDKPVFIRFAHEMNGNWYPWSGVKIGKDKYARIYRYVKDVFDKEQAGSVKWVFSVNWEDIPAENNHFALYYPGDGYVDYVGIDGYNWGNTRAWSRWMSFKDIFWERCAEAGARFKKPLLISEFSSTSSGGDKARWIKKAMRAIKGMRKVKGFVLFNVDKETDWSFPADGASGKGLKEQLEDDYFKERIFGLN